MLYTGCGDSGYTSVIGQTALRKSDLRIDALGSLDEAQAHLGLARAMLPGTHWASPLRRVQQHLTLLMADIATPAHHAVTCGYLTGEHLASIEADLAVWESMMGGYCGFVVPGDSMPEAQLHVARTVVRRAERLLVALSEREPVNPLALTYLNRLSSWVFTLSCLVTVAAVTTAA